MAARPSPSIVTRTAARLAALALAAGIAACPGPPQANTTNATTPTATGGSSADHPRVIVVSVDGMMPAVYMNPDTHGLRVHTLRALRESGAYSPGVRSVFPTVTYPSHTSIATGVNPGTHGIVSNESWDPPNKNQGGWYWYTEDIAVHTIWQVARDAGRQIALINWPVTVGARADAIVPEYWRAGTPDDAKLARALSTPGLLEATAARFPGFWDRFTPPDIIDSASIDVAIHLIETAPPDLMMIHIWMVDEYQHQRGPWSPEAKARIEEADAQIGRLIEALRAAELWNDTVLVVTSDHGFLAIDKRIYPGVALAQRGLVTVEGDGSLSAWKAIARANGGQAYIYVADGADDATRAQVREVFAQLAADPAGGVARVIEADEIRALGGDPKAFLALDAKPGFAFSGGYTGALVRASGSKGHHGFHPDRPEMNASLLVAGPRIAPGAIEGARLIDLAPTIAGWLGLALPAAEGKPLAVELRPAGAANP